MHGDVKNEFEIVNQQGKKQSQLKSKKTQNVDSKSKIISAFILNEEGLFYRGEDKDGNPTLTRISSPLTIVAETQTNTGENYGRLVEWKDSKGRIHKWSLPIELVHSESNEHIKYLVSRGLEVKPSKFSRQKLSEYIAESKPEQTVICTDKTGWQDNFFVLPDLTIGQTEKNESVIFQSANSLEHSFQTNETLSQWQENIARLCAGNSRLVFAVSVAFASALLTPLQESGGGFHYRGASSLGKSTALLVGGSVWGGNSRHGFLNTWRSTSNGLEAVAELHNDALLCVDELKECDPKTASETAYMLANGHGKRRMSKTIFARKSLAWTLLFLSSGELSLSDLIEQNGGRSYGGQEVRMCDIQADAEKGFGLFENLHEFPTAELFAKQLSENSKKYYGVAIREFLQSVSESLEFQKTRWIDFRHSFMEKILPKDATSEVQRVAARFALVAFGGWLARDICGWSETEAIKACQTVFATWLNGRSGKGNSDTEKALKQVKLFLEKHESSRFQNLDLTGENLTNEFEKTIEKAGFKRKNANGTFDFLVFTGTFSKEICKGFDFRLVANELAKRQLLETSGNDLSKQVKINGTNRRFYIINAKIFDLID